MVGRTSASFCCVWHSNLKWPRHGSRDWRGVGDVGLKQTHTSALKLSTFFCSQKIVWGVFTPYNSPALVSIPGNVLFWEYTLVLSHLGKLQMQISKTLLWCSFKACFETIMTHIEWLMSHIINPVAPYLSKFQGERNILMESKKSAVKPNTEKIFGEVLQGSGYLKDLGESMNSWLSGRGAEVEVKHPCHSMGVSPFRPFLIATRGSRAGWTRALVWKALPASLAKDRKCKLILIRDHSCGLWSISLNQTLATVNFFFHPRPKSCKHKDRNKSLKQALVHIYGKHTKL